MTETPLLVGRVGSHAYGLAHADSDEDFLGTFAAPATTVAGLYWSPKDETHTDTSPDNPADTTMHEIGKFLRLTLKSNPTVTELLWLHLDEYTEIAPLGYDLLKIRETLLSEKYVLAAYRGYASAQLTKFAESGEWKPKHARHALRLINQGLSALETGRVTVRVPDAQIYWDLAKMAPDAVLDLLKRELEKFDSVITSPLPYEPDTAPAKDFLREVRLNYFD